MASVLVRKGHAKPLWAGHPWVFRGAIARVEGGPEPGDLVDVRDASEAFIGRGYWNPNSNITVRILTRDEKEAVDAGFFLGRIGRAAEMRRRLGIPACSDSYRLVHGEGDSIPGLVVDKYGDWLCVQPGTLGINLRLDLVLDALEETFSPSGILARPDPHFAGIEGFEPPEGVLRGSAPAGPVTIAENGVRFEVDLSGGQKTGFYFDQRDNRMRVAGLSGDARVLDCCSYTGAFAIYCRVRGACRGALAVEASPPAVAAARRNVALNSADGVEVIRADVSVCLKALASEGRRFDVVVTDPPKFVHKAQGLEDGVKAYRALNRLALRVVEAGGFLAACSCSGLLSEERFERMLAEAAADAGRSVRIVERRGQAPDHPVNPACPESRYLKCFICAVD